MQAYTLRVHTVIVAGHACYRPLKAPSSDNLRTEVVVTLPGFTGASQSSLTSASLQGSSKNKFSAAHSSWSLADSTLTLAVASRIVEDTPIELKLTKANGMELPATGVAEDDTALTIEVRGSVFSGVQSIDETPVVAAIMESSLS